MIGPSSTTLVHDSYPPIFHIGLTMGSCRHIRHWELQKWVEFTKFTGVFFGTFFVTHPLVSIKHFGWLCNIGDCCIPVLPTGINGMSQGLRTLLRFWTKGIGKTCEVSSVALRYCLTAKSNQVNSCHVLAGDPIFQQVKWGIIATSSTCFGIFSINNHAYSNYVSFCLGSTLGYPPTH